MMTLFTKKHQPKTLSEVQGHSSVLHSFKNSVITKRPVLLYGSTGTGKTSSVYALAKDLSYEVFEINASDFRNKEKINSLVGSSLNQASLFHKGKIVLIDELDGLSGRKDRGAIPTLATFLKNPPHPVVLITEDPWDSKFTPLRKHCNLLELKKPSYLFIFNVLKEITNRENISISENILRSIAIRANGDFRAAVNDLQALYHNNPNIDVNIMGERYPKESIINAIRTVFKSSSTDSLNAFDSVDADHKQLFLWIDENLPYEYSSESLINAYDTLSKADVISGRIKMQNWRLLAYVYDLLSAGIALSKTKTNSSFVNYKKPMKLLKIWRYKMKNAQKMKIAEKIANKNHTSKKRAIKEMPFMKSFLLKKENIDFFDFDDEDLEFLRES